MVFRHLSDVSEPACSQHEILVAHYLGDRGCNLRNDGPLKLLQFNIAIRVIKQMLPELTDRHAANMLKCFLIEGTKN